MARAILICRCESSISLAGRVLVRLTFFSRPIPAILSSWNHPTFPTTPDLPVAPTKKIIVFPRLPQKPQICYYYIGRMLTSLLSPLPCPMTRLTCSPTALADVVSRRR
jgi:hypothetical protein